MLQLTKDKDEKEILKLLDGIGLDEQDGLDVVMEVVKALGQQLLLGL